MDFEPLVVSFTDIAVASSDIEEDKRKVPFQVEVLNTDDSDEAMELHNFLTRIDIAKIIFYKQKTLDEPKIEFNFHDGGMYDRDMMSIILVGERLESDTEVTDRLNKSQIYREKCRIENEIRRKEEERKEYERLKKIYGA